MNGIIILMPMLVPIVGTLFLAARTVKNQNTIKRIVASSVLVNALFVIFINFYMDVSDIHLLKVNNFLDIYFKVDRLGVLFSTMASFLWILTSWYAFGYMAGKPRLKQFYVFFTVTLAVVMGIAYSGNLFTLYAFYELLTLATLPLVMYNGNEQALSSGKKYMIYSFTGATFILFGMMLLYSVTGDMSFVPLGLTRTVQLNNSNILLISYISMFVGFGVKAALVPFHTWLPAAMVAPTPVSALLHAVAVVKSGVFSIIRITYFIFGAASVRYFEASKYLIPLVVVTVVMGSFLALHQDHLKKRLAYSTISQLGYMLLGILLLNPDGLRGSILHLVNHAMIKITLFFIVGAITMQTHKKHIHEIYGIGKAMPLSMMCFSIAAISLVGIPPTNGFVSKWFLGLGALTSSNLFFILILLISALLTAGYLIPIIVAAFFSSHREDLIFTDSINLDPPKSMMVPILIITGIVILLGLFPNPLMNFIDGVIVDAF